MVGFIAQFLIFPAERKQINRRKMATVVFRVNNCDPIPIILKTNTTNGTC